MTCCARKRSPNDTLRDSATGRNYCGTCWQHWYDGETAGAPTPERSAPDPPSDGDGEDAAADPAGVDGGTADPAAHPTLDGIVHDGALYLVDRATRHVFHAERTSAGLLRVAGRLCDDDTLELSTPPTSAASGAAVAHPFEADPDDHCETPAAAFAELAPVLRQLARQLGRAASALRIWDPYYCAGGSARRLRRLGFASVRNEPEDFYAVVASGALPEHDVIVTNPPYSTAPTDHVHELVRILVSIKSPFFVVQPAYVYTRPFWPALTAELPGPRPFFLAPATPRRYKYRTPDSLRDAVKAGETSGAARKRESVTSPFVTFWYCWTGARHTEQLYKWLAREKRRGDMPLTLACTEFFLPDSFKDSSDRTRRKKRKERRVEGVKDAESLSVATVSMKNTNSEQKQRKKRKKKKTKKRGEGSAHEVSES